MHIRSFYIKKKEDIYEQIVPKKKKKKRGESNKGKGAAQKGRTIRRVEI
jgi:hypothetical protein